MTPAADTGPRRMDADIFAQARKALDERPSIPGVRRIVNKITVAPPPSEEGFEPPVG